jgi:hypothetical protein
MEERMGASFSELLGGGLAGGIGPSTAMLGTFGGHASAWA